MNLTMHKTASSPGTIFLFWKIVELKNADFSASKNAGKFFWVKNQSGIRILRLFYCGCL